MTPRKIMVVEDEGIVAADVGEQLKRLGYEVTDVVASGEEALRRLEAAPPDLVLMDIVLNNQLDGVETARQIRERFDVPVVFLTAFADDETLQRAEGSEPFGYILKPFGDRELHVAVETALRRHQSESHFREAHQWLSAILQNLSEAVITSGADDRVIFMNAAAEELTGWPLAEALGRNVGEIFCLVNEQSQNLLEHPSWKAPGRVGTVYLGGDTLLVARGGTKKPVTGSATPIRNERGEKIGVVAVFSDVIRRIRAEEEMHV